jgi:hypothetical protein
MPALGSLAEVQMAKHCVYGASQTLSKSDFNERVRHLPEQIVVPRKAGGRTRNRYGSKPGTDDASEKA